MLAMQILWSNDLLWWKVSIPLKLVRRVPRSLTGRSFTNESKVIPCVYQHDELGISKASSLTVTIFVISMVLLLVIWMLSSSAELVTIGLTERE